MTALVRTVARYGVSLVFINVLLEQIGAPLPAVPTLIVAGALSRNGKMSSTNVLIVSIIASLIADWLWFALGRAHGYRILRTLCKISLSPDSCVRDTEARFERWGLKSLLIAKFIPGFSTVAPPLAGAAGWSTFAFLIYDGIGALLWAGSAIAAGRIFHRAIGDLLQHLESLGGWAVTFVVCVLVIFIALKWLQRARFLKQLRTARISPDELHAMFARGETPVILDVRTHSSRAHDPRRIPTAIVVEPNDLDHTIERTIAAVSPGQEIVLYCT